MERLKSDYSDLRGGWCSRLEVETGEEPVRRRVGPGGHGEEWNAGEADWHRQRVRHAPVGQPQGQCASLRMAVGVAGGLDVRGGGRNHRADPMEQDGVQVGRAPDAADKQGGEDERSGAGPETVSHGCREYNRCPLGGSSLAPRRGHAKFRPLE